MAMMAYALFRYHQRANAIRKKSQAYDDRIGPVRPPFSLSLLPLAYSDPCRLTRMVCCRRAVDYPVLRLDHQRPDERGLQAHLRGVATVLPFLISRSSGLIYAS
jgi:hypothetical protein